MEAATADAPERECMYSADIATETSARSTSANTPYRRGVMSPVYVLACRLLYRLNGGTQMLQAFVEVFIPAIDRIHVEKRRLPLCREHAD